MMEIKEMKISEVVKNQEKLSEQLKDVINPYLTEEMMEGINWEANNAKLQN